MMRPPYFEVSARCNQSKCPTTDFKVDRRKVVKKSSEGNEYTIGQVVCPGCRMWAEVTGIREVK